MLSFEEPHWYPMLRQTTVAGNSRLCCVDEESRCTIYHNHAMNTHDEILLNSLLRESSELLEHA